jgi:hypothetical protein
MPSDANTPWHELSRRLMAILSWIKYIDRSNIVRDCFERSAKYLSLSLSLSKIYSKRLFLSDWKSYEFSESLPFSLSSSLLNSIHRLYQITCPRLSDDFFILCCRFICIPSVPHSARFLSSVQISPSSDSSFWDFSHCFRYLDWAIRLFSFPPFCHSYSLWSFPWTFTIPGSPIICVISNTWSWSLTIWAIGIETRCPYCERSVPPWMIDSRKTKRVMWSVHDWNILKENIKSLSDHNDLLWSELAQREADQIHSHIGSFVKHFQNRSELFDSEMKT